jgi:hypothetical protein
MDWAAALAWDLRIVAFLKRLSEETLEALEIEMLRVSLYFFRQTTKLINSW